MYVRARMELLFVTAEIAPLTGETPAAQAVAALAKALRALDHRVTVVAPLFAEINPAERGLARRLRKVEGTLPGVERQLSEAEKAWVKDGKVGFHLYDGRTAGGVDVLLLGHPMLEGVTSLDESDTTVDPARRALVAGAFASAAAELACERDPAIELLHGHDWVGALAVDHVRRAHPELTTVFTLHSLTSQGQFAPNLADRLGLHDETLEALTSAGQLNMMLGGIRSADRVITDSVAVADQLRAGENIDALRGPHPLSAAFMELDARLLGVPAGVDAAHWNSATDAHLASRFTPMDMNGKTRCKAELQRRLELPVRDNVPLLGILLDGADRHGVSNLIDLGPSLLRNDCQIAVGLRDVDEESVQSLAMLTERWPDRIRTCDATDVNTAHALVGSCDLLLPLTGDEVTEFAMRAHRYGTLPIVPAVAHVKDAVVDCDAKLESGTGILYAPNAPAELLAGIRRGLAAFGVGAMFNQTVVRLMRVDHNWERSARLYESAYRAAQRAD